MTRLRHFLNLGDAGGNAIAAMIADALDRKAARKGWPSGRPDPDAPLAGHVLATVFEKNSTRTRISFDIAMRQLGGSTLVLDAGTSQLGRGESVGHTARVLGRTVDAIMVRTDDHAKVQEMARHAGVPVINGLTDVSHPCQIVADLLTIIEHDKSLPGLEFAWLGDCNNVLNSVIEAAGLMRFNLRIGTATDIEPDVAFVETAKGSGARIDFFSDAGGAVYGADVVATDTWISMGQPHAADKLAQLKPFQVDSELMTKAKDDALFMHCLPAHLGEEVTARVFDGRQSVVFDQAENRLHAQKSILLWAFGLLP